MSNTKDIQRRIKSVESTQKITRAMEMVAANKMKRAVDAVFKSRSYANLGWKTALHIANALGSSSQPAHPFLSPTLETPEKIGVVLITSNRGLCGSFNINVVNKMHQAIKEFKQKRGDLKVDINILGKKGYAARKYYGYEISREFPKKDLIIQYTEITPIARAVMDDFLSGEYDTVYVAYTDYISSSKQMPRTKQLLPINIKEKDEHLGKVARVFGQTGEIDKDTQQSEEMQRKKFIETDYTFEPSAEELLEDILPRLVETQLFQALLESNASEHSVRMFTMHQATDSADDMKNELRLTYNKMRQAAITSEISEISAGVEALSQ